MICFPRLRDAAVILREIRIDRFGCWEMVRIAPLHPGLTIVHLRDGGTPTEFLQFVHQTWFGFPQRTAESNPWRGALLWDESSHDRWLIQRQQLFDGRRQSKLQRGITLNSRIESQSNHVVSDVASVVSRVQGELAIDLLGSVFFSLLPTSMPTAPSNSTRLLWGGVTGHIPELAQCVVPSGPMFDSSQVAWLTQVSQISVQSSGRVIRDLAQQRQSLRAALQSRMSEVWEQVAAAHAPSKWVDTTSPTNSPSPTSTAASPSPFSSPLSPRSAIAELEDERNRLQRRREPLKLACDVFSDWSSRQTLVQQISTAPTPDDLELWERLFSEFQQLSLEIETTQKLLEHQSDLGSDQRRDPRSDHRDRKFEFELKKLLDRASWVRGAATRPSGTSEIALNTQVRTPFIGEDILRAAQAVRDAQRHCDELAVRLEHWQSSKDLPLKNSNIGPQWFPERPDYAEWLQRLSDLYSEQKVAAEEVERATRRPVFPPHILWPLVGLFGVGVACLASLFFPPLSLRHGILAGLGLLCVTSAVRFKSSIEEREEGRLVRTRQSLRTIQEDIQQVLAELAPSRHDPSSVLTSTDCHGVSQTSTFTHGRDFAEQQALQEEHVRHLRMCDDANGNLRRLLRAHGLPSHLTPSEIEQQYDSRSTNEQGWEIPPITHAPLTNATFAIGEGAKPPGGRETFSHVDGRADRKLQQWIHRARSLCHRIDGYRPPQEVDTILERLEEHYRDVRNRILRRKSDQQERATEHRDRRRLQSDLDALVARQRAILARCHVADPAGIRALIDEAERMARLRHRVVQLEQNLDAKLDQPHGTIAREILKTTRDGGKQQLSDLDARLEQIAVEIERLKIPTPLKLATSTQIPSPPLPPLPPSPPLPLQDDIDRLRLQLASNEARLRKAIHHAQVLSVTRRAATTVLRRMQGEAGRADRYLQWLSDGQWQALRVRDGAFWMVSATQDRLSVMTAVERDSRMAWLALQLAIAEQRRQQQHHLPLLLDLDQILASSTEMQGKKQPDGTPSEESEEKENDSLRTRLFQLLQQVARDGQQIIAITGDARLASKLAKEPIPLVHIGRQAEETPPSSAIENDDSELQNPIPDEPMPIESIATEPLQIPMVTEPMTRESIVPIWQSPSPVEAPRISIATYQEITPMLPPLSVGRLPSSPSGPVLSEPQPIARIIAPSSPPSPTSVPVNLPGGDSRDAIDYEREELPEWWPD